MTSQISDNIASHLPSMAKRVPQQNAVIVPQSTSTGANATYAAMTFSELEALSNRFANGLTKAGMSRGMRVLLMVRPGFDFVALVFALFKMGAVPVMIDPGMGAKRMLDCIRQVDLHGFVGIPLAHVMRVLKPSSFRTVRHAVTVGRRWFWGGSSLGNLARDASDQFTIVETTNDDDAAILFTSGSTGPAKGVVYKHGMFNAQVSMIQSQYGIQPGEIDLPTFPLFALFSVAMGMTIVIPDMDPSHPAAVDPAKIVGAIRDQQVTNTFGSPAVWKKVAHYCVHNDVKLPTLRRILIAGAPVPDDVIAQLHHTLSAEADVHTPYGATESLPVATISGREIVGGYGEMSRRGAGTCVGLPFDGVDVRCIKVTDEPIERWSDDLLVNDGELGEIIVAGQMVTQSYFGLPDATRNAKIMDQSRIWHRMGDVGYRDGDGRIWFCGRKSHRIQFDNQTLYADQCEAVFNVHPKVARTGLVGTGPPGDQTPVLIVEPQPKHFPSPGESAVFEQELAELAQANDLTHSIKQFRFHRSLPVDVRHNAKINRERLREQVS